MKSQCSAPSLRAFRPITALFVFACLIPVVGINGQDDDATVVRVEEDWELVVKAPDQNSAGPQVVCTISPHSHVNSVHVALELNHQSLPEFVAGGLQLQAWLGETPLTSHKFPGASLLNHSNEVVRWTQSMRLQDGKLIVEVTNGTSQSWGNFGGQGYLKWWIASDLSSLASYSTAVSANNSGISYGANLVQSLEIKKVRKFMSDGTVQEADVDVCVCGTN